MEVRRKSIIKDYFRLFEKVVLLLMTIVVGMTFPKLAQAAGSSVTVSRTADIVFIIDTTGSMGNEIENVKRNINKFIDKVSAENVDVRFRFVSFRDGGTYTGIAPYNNPDTYPSDLTWYTKSTVQDAKTALESGPFASLGGGGYGESPLVPMAKIANTYSDYFKLSDGSISTAQFCILITDEKYEAATYYQGYSTPTDANSQKVPFGAANYVDTLADKTGTSGKKGIVEEMTQNGINTSVITKGGLFSNFAKFVTKPTVASGNDGGMLSDIDGDFDIIFEKLADKVVTQTDIKYKKVISKLYRKPIKVCANMIVVKKERGFLYQIAEGEAAEDGSDDSKLTWSQPQSSCVFKDLKPSTKYSIKVVDSNNTNMVYDRYTLETESTTGARYSEIPKVVYEGEVYNIKLDGTLRQLMVTSGSSITWSCASDCVSVTPDKVGYGCQMSIRDCQYNKDKLLKVTLVADVSYSVSDGKGRTTKKSMKFNRTFSIENTVDALDIGEFHGSTENTMVYGVIVLTTTEGVKLDMIVNQGEERDTASRQKMKYYISDEYGNVNRNGSKIAKVSGDGTIKGVHAGLTYLTIAPAHLYNKYAKNYDFMYTIPILCPETLSVEFDDEELKKVDPNDFKYVLNSIEGAEDQYIIETYVKKSINLRSFLKYNPSEVFNPTNMKQEWTSSDSSVARVNAKGIVSCKGPGYVTITMTPVGGLKVSALTGKRDVNAKLCNASITIKVLEKPKA